MYIKETIKQQIKNTLELRRAIRLVWDSSRRWTIANIFLLVLQGLLPLLSLYLLKLMLDSVVAALEIVDKDAAFADVMVVVVLAGLVTLLSNLARTIGSFVSSMQGRIVADYMNDILHAKSIEVDLEYYENAQYFDTLHRAQQEAAFRPLMIVNGLAQVFQNTISLVGTLWLLLTFHWIIGLILLVAVGPGMIVRLNFSRIMYALQRQYTPEDRRSWYFKNLMTGAEYAKEVRIFELGSIFMQQYQELRLMLRGVKTRIDLQRSSAEFVVQIIATIAVFGSYAFVAYSAVMGAITLGSLVMYYQAFQRGQGFLQNLLGSLASLYENNLFISDLYEFLDIQRQVIDPEHPQPIPQPMQQGIVIENIDFQYPNTTRSALEDISLTIRPGEVIALVGANGSGKTTLVKLLCRLYDPTAGRITIDGIDLSDFGIHELRQQISIIFQDYAKYNLTAKQNIGFGNTEVWSDLEKIITAAKHAGAHEVIENLPDGYDTILGKLFDHGEELSIGQWQKVALARAFLRDSQLIVLDEPTSAMDPKAEYEVFKSFRQLLDGRSAILISHRLSTVRMADRIYVLQDGHIIESGSHDELVYRDGTYAHLFETQAKNYR